MKKSKNALQATVSSSKIATPPTTSSITDLMHDHHSSSVGSPPPPLTLPSSYFKNTDSYLHLVRPGVNSGFSPYYNPNVVASSSPKYATPPLPSDSMLPSPIPDFRHESPASKYYYDQAGPHPGPQVAPSSTNSAQQPLSLTSVSPTSGVIFELLLDLIQVLRI